MIAYCCYGCDHSFDEYEDEDEPHCPFCGSADVVPFDDQPEAG